MSSKPIQFVDLKTQYAVLKPQIMERIVRVLDHGQYVMGPEVRELEERLETFSGAQHCVSVASGSDALLIALMALGVGAGDEIITTPFTFAATAEMIALLGARPVFVDIEPETCNIDAGLIESKISERTKAIMPVSLYGQPADMDEINAIAERCKLAVIEDAAQSFGALYKGRRSCNLSTVGCTSFFPSKPLGCYGDGGAIFTNNTALAKTCREIRVHGQSDRYFHTRIGVGGRMDTLQCAVVLAKLDRFDSEIERRQAIGAKYNHIFDSARVPRIHQRADRTSVFAQYTILAEGRDRLREILKEQGVPTAVHYPTPLNEQPAYRKMSLGDATPVAADVSRRVVSLPMSADLSENDQTRIAALVSANVIECASGDH